MPRTAVVVAVGVSVVFTVLFLGALLLWGMAAYVRSIAGRYFHRICRPPLEGPIPCATDASHTLADVAWAHAMMAYYLHCHPEQRAWAGGHRVHPLGGRDRLGYVLTTGDTAIVSFRGIFTAHEVFRMITSSHRLVEPGWVPGRIHGDLGGVYRTIRPDLFRAVGACRDVLITGHSAGGGVALLAATDLHLRGVGVRGVVFGAPCVGDREFTDSIPDSVISRINSCDMAPLFPYQRGFVMRDERSRPNAVQRFFRDYGRSIDNHSISHAYRPQAKAQA